MKRTTAAITFAALLGALAAACLLVGQQSRSMRAAGDGQPHGTSPETATAGATAADAAGAPTQRKILFYRSPMHPWVTSPTPGKCTVCGMNLAPVFAEEDAPPAAPATPAASAKTPSSAPAPSAPTPATPVIRLSAASASVIGVETAVARVAPLRRTVRVAGVVSDDETRRRVLSARVAGRVEKLHVNQTGARVTAGEPLAVIYSPELLTAQRLYLENRRVVDSGAVSRSEVATSRERLLALGMEREDVARLEHDGRADALLLVRAPYAGTVIARSVFEGQYVAAEAPLFEIGDLSAPWVLFDIYERDLPLVATRQAVEVTFANGTGSAPLRGEISFIDPNIDAASRTARARVVVPNPTGKIFHRQTAEGVLRLETPPVLLVPRSAVLRTGGAPVAYVARTGGYEPRALSLGREGDTEVEVLAGVTAGERVVTQAALLLDNQARIEGIAPEPPASPAASPAPAKPCH
ncbi:MAG: efflux RND transporter periplasmic adaptor subunit [Puniceicoccales bacterium]|nr:efflux RND transporter periplasmic adaptor subunit [Puniceicoccales bacterium]